MRIWLKFPAQYLSIRFKVRTDNLRSVTTSYLAVKIKALRSLKVKDHLLNQINNGVLTLLAILRSCNAPVLLGCQRSKPISHLDKESSWEKSAWHLIVIPWSMAENSAIIIIQTDFDEPAHVHIVTSPPKWGFIPRYHLRVITINCALCMIVFGKKKSLKVSYSIWQKAKSSLVTYTIWVLIFTLDVQKLWITNPEK